MRTVEILDKIPGLKRDQLQYWQKRGFICAEKFIRGKRLVSDYPKNELKKIELMFEYVNSGDTPSVAYAKATEDLRSRFSSSSSPNKGNGSQLTDAPNRNSPLELDAADQELFQMFRELPLHGKKKALGFFKDILGLLRR